VAANLDTIRDVGEYVIPKSSNDELMIIARLLSGVDDPRT
jgi:hypothetical protein